MSIHKEPVFRNCVDCKSGKNAEEIKEIWHRPCYDLQNHSDWKFCTRFSFLVLDKDGCTFGDQKEVVL